MVVIALLQDDLYWVEKCLIWSMVDRCFKIVWNFKNKRCQFPVSSNS